MNLFVPSVETPENLCYVLDDNFWAYFKEMEKRCFIYEREESKEKEVFNFGYDEHGPPMNDSMMGSDIKILFIRK